MRRNGRMSSDLSGPPNAISRTESNALTRHSSGRQLVDHVDERDDVIDRRVLVDAVPEIEDVARPSADRVQNVLHRATDLTDVREQHGGIEIPLHCDVVTEPVPRRTDLDAPIEPDHIAAGLL